MGLGCLGSVSKVGMLYAHGNVPPRILERSVGKYNVLSGNSGYALWIGSVFPVSDPVGTAKAYCIPSGTFLQEHSHLGFVVSIGLPFHVSAFYSELSSVLVEINHQQHCRYKYLFYLKIRFNLTPIYHGKMIITELGVNKPKYILQYHSWTI